MPRKAIPAWAQLRILLWARPSTNISKRWRNLSFKAVHDVDLPLPGNLRLRSASFLGGDLVYVEAHAQQQGSATMFGYTPNSKTLTLSPAGFSAKGLHGYTRPHTSALFALVNK
eukprot:2361463-Amphidinium_carterae.2